MKKELKNAVTEAAINGLFIFTYSLGLGALAKIYGFADVSYTFLLLQSGGLALVRFATRLREEEGIDADGLNQLPGIPGGTRKGWKKPSGFMTRHRLGKVI